MLNPKLEAILQVLPSLHSGGVERGTIEIAGAINEAGYASLVASAGGPLVTSIAHHGAKHFLLPLASKNPWQIIKNSFHLAKLIREKNIKIIHARSRAPAWSAYLAAKQTNCKFVTTFHGIYKYNNTIKKLYNSIMTKGDKVIAVSNFTAEHIKSNYNIDENNLVTIHRGVDMNYFNPENINQQRVIQLANKLHINMERPIILLPGRITRWKGHKFLLNALKLLPPKSFSCIIAGDVQKHIGYRNELEKLIKKNNLSEDVAIINNVADMPALYMLADVVISASIQPEAFGRVVTEAQAMGRFVIATNIGGACETIIPGQTGWLVTPDNNEELANAIHNALNIDPELRKEKSIFMRNHIEQNFSKQKMCSKTLAIYKQLLT